MTSAEAQRPRRRTIAATVLALCAALTVATPTAGANTAQDGATPTFTESSGCGYPSTSKPQASRKGWLPDSEPVRGPAGDFFGRTIGSIRSQLVWWDVPMSNGERIKVHQRALPAFELVAANLASEEAAGRYYGVRSIDTYGFAARTISNRYSLSYHALGTAVDINARNNPLRRDNVLITNMPQWFVDAWVDAGFCWGGYWNDSKDTMHFAWMGPERTPGYGAIPPDQPVSSAPAGFTFEVQNTSTPFGDPGPGSRYAIAEASGDGAVDVVQVTQNPWGAIVDYSRAGDRHAWCSVRRDHAAGASLAGKTVLFGDHHRTGRNDLWLVGDEGGLVTATIYSKADDFSTSVSYVTDLAAAPGDVYLVGDHNGDRIADLFVVRTGPATSLDVRLGPDFASGPATSATGLGETTPHGWGFTLADRDLDGVSDLHALEHGDSARLHILLAASGYSAVAESHDVGDLGPLAAMGFADFDGEGRPDLQVLDAGGTMRAFLGNQPVYADLDGWFVAPSWSCSSDAEPYGHDGTFRDDDGNVHEADIEAIAARGITMGCNPPYGDEYCPDRAVTRGEMAAFVIRLLGRPGEGATDHFIDDAESIFQGDINRLASAGIARGCNPPDNDRYCPDRVMTRSELAAMLVRALGLTEAGDGDRFVDDDGSVFEQDIERLAFAGVTRGCNPPLNDRFCPSASVMRDEMASFLERAAGLLDG